MATFIFWLGLALLVGVIGKDRKIGFGLSFFLSVLLSPIIGLVITLFSKKKKSKAELLSEAKIYLDSGAITPLEYSKMMEDIMNKGEIRDVSKYRNNNPTDRKNVIDPFKH